MKLDLIDRSSREDSGVHHPTSTEGMNIMIGLLLLLVLAAVAVVFTFIAAARDGYGALPADMSNSMLSREEPAAPVSINRLG
jgi:hypothetical protein